MKSSYNSTKPYTAASRAQDYGSMKSPYSLVSFKVKSTSVCSIKVKTTKMSP